MADPFPIAPPPPAKRITPVNQQVRAIPQLTLPRSNVSIGSVPPPPGASTSNKNKPKDKGLVGGLLSSVGQIVTFPKTLAGMIPSLVGKTAQTVVGVPDMLVGQLSPGYESRFEKDAAKAKELGLTGVDALAYSLNRQLPLASAMAESLPATAGRLGEAATLGRYDYGDPGLDYYNALRQGQLGNIIIEDAGNILLVGRGLGAGSVFEAAGAAAGGRLGSVIKGTGSFMEQPIAATVRGGARVVKTGAELGGRTDLAAAAGRVAGSGLPFKPNLVERYNKRFNNIDIPVRQPGVGPLRQTFEEVVAGKRNFADKKLTEFDTKIAVINSEIDALRANDQFDPAINLKAGELANLNNKRMAWLERTGKPKQLRQFERARERVYTQYRDSFSSQFVRLQELGPVPETVEQLRSYAADLREAARQATDPVSADRINQAADFAEQKANVKEANPGALDQPLPEWVGAAGILHITGQIRDIQAALRAGKSLREILADLQPYDLAPELKDLGYSYSAESLIKALEFFNGRLDDVSSIQLQAFIETYGGWHNFFNDMAMKGQGFLKGPMPFTYQDVYPDPSLLIEELAGRAIDAEVLEVLDTAVVYVIERDAPQLKDTLGELDVNDPPAEIFTRFAKAPIDSLEYQVAAQAIIESFDYLRNSDNIAVVEFLRNKMIYPAPMRPSLGLQEQFAQTARANDVASMARSLQYIATEYGDVFNAQLLEAIDGDLAAALDPNKRFDKKTWTRLGKRLETVKARAQQILDSNAAKQTKIGGAIEAADTRLIDVMNTIEDAQRLIDILKRDPEAAFGLTPEQGVLSGLQQDIAKNQTRQTVLQNLRTSQQVRASRRPFGEGPIKPETTNLEPLLNRVDIEQRKLDKGLAARTREAETSVRVATRRRLQGIGKIEPATTTFDTLDNEGNPVRLSGANPNAEDIVMTKTTRGQLVGERDRIIADQAERTSRLEQLREKHARADELAARTEAGMDAAGRYEAQLRQPFGPEIQPEAPMYVPGGVTSSMSEAARVRLAEISTGAAPQLGASYERVKFSNLMPLSVRQVGERVSEIMGQWGRNSVIEDIIKNPEFVSTVAGKIPEDQLSILRTNAENNIRNMGIAQTSEQFAAAVRKEYGKLIMDRLRTEGYEPISPTRVDPMSMEGHAPLGDLSQKVNPENVAEDSLVMQIGMRDRIAGQYKPKFGGQDIPQGVIKAFEKIGKVTQKWKSVVLPFSIVRWQMGDAVGNLINAWVRGDIPPNELLKSINDVKARLQDPNNLKTLELLFSDVTNNPINDPVLAAGIGMGLQARGLRSPDRVALRQGTFRPSPQYAPSKYFGTFRDTMFNLNETQNTLARAGVYMNKLDETLQGMGRTIDEISPESVAADPVLFQAVSDAVSFTNETLGAFSELTPWEANVLRQAFPFWSWIKFINKAAMKLVVDNPDRVLFHAHLGSMVADPNQKDFYTWLRGKTPIAGNLYDLSFLNPYEDALLFSGNPLSATAEQFTSLSPAISFPLNALNEVVYATSGRNLIPFSPVSRPGYLEGRPGATTRGIGDVAGGIGYLGLKAFGGPFRNILGVLPEGTIPGTDVATGPVNRYPQGSARTTGAYSDPRLSPTAGRISSVLSTFGIPAPIFGYDEAVRQGKLQGIRDQQALLRRIQERAAAG